MQVIIPGLQAFIAFQCVLFAGYLVLGRKLGLLANRIQLGLLTALAIHMMFNLYRQQLHVGDMPNLVAGFGLLYGPFVHLYLRSLTRTDFCWHWRIWLHFLPALLFSVPPLAAPQHAAPAMIFSMAVYLSLSWSELHQFRQVLTHTHSARDKLAMNWALVVLLMNALSVVFNAFAAAQLFFYSDVSIGRWAEILLLLVLLFMVSAFLFKGLMQPQLFAGTTAEDRAIAEQVTKPSPKTELSAERREQIKTALLHHMQNRKPYLETLFNLQALGRQLGESPRHVSLVINSMLLQNFSDFVNDYRLKEVKDCLADPADQRPILDIIYACGFSTKSNFNRLFKQATGLTPSEYRSASQQAGILG